MTVVGGDQATCGGRSAGKPIKAAAFAIPNKGMGLDNIGDDEGGPCMAGDDRTWPAVLQENRAQWLARVKARRDLSGQYEVGGSRLRDRGLTARVAVAHNRPAAAFDDSTCKAAALGGRACGCLGRGRVGKERKGPSGVIAGVGCRRRRMQGGR